MKIFIDIGHPAHVHYFKNLISKLEKEGHTFFITARDKEVTFDLLENLKVRFISRGRGEDNIIGKVLYTFKADYILFKKAFNFKPDLFLSFASPYAAHVSKLLGKPHIAFDDTENAKLAHRLYRPFTEVIYSPSSYKGKLHERQILFNGFMELCYLHPKYFRPDLKIRQKLGVGNDQKYVILRFVSWSANHDIGHNGLSLQHKLKCVDEFSKYAKVFITSEKKLPSELEKYRLQVPPSSMHDVLASSTLLYGESATMSSECATLGVPSIYHDDEGRGYTTELEEKYGLVFNFGESLHEQEKGLQRAVEILQENDPSKYVFKRNKLLDDKVDVVEFMIKAISKYQAT